MVCKLNLKAPNGKNSILFKDIAETVKDPNEAVDLYFLTKTEGFKNHYKGKFDENGEPIYKEFSQDAYVDDVDYNNIELDSSAEVYKKLLTTIPNLMVIIDDRIDFLSSQGDKKYVDQLSDLYEVLDKEQINSSLPKFLEMSRVHTFHLRKNAEKAANDPNSDIRLMASYHKVAQSYSIVNDLKTLFAGNPELSEVFEGPIKNMGEISDYIRDVEAMYLNKSTQFLADEFHKRDNTWSKREIKEALHKTSRDILWTEQMLEYMGDSRDKVLSMVASVMMEAEHKVRRQAIDFNKNLQSVLEEVEKANPGTGDEVFKDLLVESNEGEFHVIDPDVKYTDGKNLFADKMYAQLQKVKNNRPLMEYLRFHTDMMKDLEASLPANARVGTRLPSVLRSEWELMSGKTPKEKYTLIADSVKKRFQRSNLDMERGQLSDATGKPLRRIPTFYTQRYNSIDFDNFFKEHYEKNIDSGMDADTASEQAAIQAEKDAIKVMGTLISKDLASSLQSFHAMATNYAAKNELIHIFDSAEALVGSKDRRYTLVDSAGRTQINPKTGLEVTKGGDTSNAYKLLTKFLDMQLYGQKEKDLGFIDVMGAKIDVNTTLRALNNSTGFIQQAGNVLAGLGNISNGEYNNIMESIGGEFFTVKDYSKASGIYKRELFGIMQDIGARTPSNIVNLLEEHYNILQSFGGDDIKTTERTKARRLMKTNSAYFIQSSGEHFMQLRAGLAMLNNIELFTKEGESKGSLLDSHSVKDGKLSVPSGLYIKGKDGELVKFDTTQQNRISNKIGAVLRKMHGNYSNKTANAMQQDARTALIMKFRGWMYEGIKKRYGKKRQYHMMESEMEGFYRTGGNALWTLLKDLKAMNLNLSKENWANLTPHEKANIRRFITETSAVTLTALAGALLGNAGKLMENYDTDDPYDRAILGAYAMLNYQVNRLHTEIFAYLNPAEAIKLMKTPMASTSILVNLTDLIGQTLDPFEEYETGWRKGQNKLSVRIEKLVPIYKQITTLNADGIKDRGAWLIQ